jgi:hypothetical protein
VEENNKVLVIPPFQRSPELKIDLSRVRDAESRIIEAKTVNPSTYKDLEYTFNEAWRDLKRYLSALGYEVAMAEKAMEDARATVFLDTYPEFMAGKPKSHDNADMRKAFLSRDTEYSLALDRFNQLKAVESMLDGKAKSFENICRYMKKSIDLVLRSGLSSSDLYNTYNRK